MPFLEEVSVRKINRCAVDAPCPVINFHDLIVAVPQTEIRM